MRRSVVAANRSRTGCREEKLGFIPPETWYEPGEVSSSSYRIIEQDPGEGYQHVVSGDEVRGRLNEMPAQMLEQLDVIQLSRMTRKKQSFPCYGMQWGNSLYLYPIETNLIESFNRPPRPAEFNETRMYGGRWQQQGNSWQLVWTPESIKDFYLNNILIHELGHLLDDRNSSYVDRERYAEWFALEYGYKPSRRKKLAKSAARRVIRRHHSR